MTEVQSKNQTFFLLSSFFFINCNWLFIRGSRNGSNCFISMHAMSIMHTWGISWDWFSMNYSRASFTLLLNTTFSLTSWKCFSLCFLRISTLKVSFLLLISSKFIGLNDNNPLIITNAPVSKHTSIHNHAPSRCTTDRRWQACLCIPGKWPCAGISYYRHSSNSFCTESTPVPSGKSYESGRTPCRF